MSQTFFPVVASNWTAADVVRHWGPIPLHRICMDPLPGTANEDDLIRLHDRNNRIYELVSAALVEKDMGTYEAYLATRLAFYLGLYLEQKSLGIILGADGMLRLKTGLVRVPDVSFISKQRMQGINLASQPIADVIPNLVVEIVSQGNTSIEMDRKLNEYFEHGVDLVWYIYPQTKSAIVFISPTDFEVLSESGVLNGKDVLPGFALRLETLFQS